MASADVATAKAKATLIIIVSSPYDPFKERFLEGSPVEHSAGSVGVSVVLNTKAFTPCRTPAGASADLAGGGPQHADTLDSYLTGAACLADLRNHAVRLMKRHG
jgi:hypothetical protein